MPQAVCQMTAAFVFVALLGSALGAPDAASFVGAPSAGGDLASAPAPGSPAPAADTLFTLSAAGMVLAADSLKLTGVATTTLFSTAGSKAGVYTTAEFANASAKALFMTAEGMWLNDPVAVVHATLGDKPVSALLRLSAPSYDSAGNVLTFKSQILPADRAAALPTSGGVSARLVDDSQNGVAAGLLASAPADGSRLMSVGLFIDVNSQALNVAGVTKQITLCFGGGCNGGGGGGGGGWRGDGWRGDGWRGDGWGGRGGDGWRGDRGGDGGWDGDRRG